MIGHLLFLVYVNKISVIANLQILTKSFQKQASNKAAVLAAEMMSKMEKLNLHNVSRIKIACKSQTWTI